jgi:hypothetical protein
MTTKQPADQDIDLSDIPEVTDFSKAVRGRFHPRRLELEREVRRLRQALEAARPYVEGSVDLPEHSRDEVLEQIDAALSRAS